MFLLARVVPNLLKFKHAVEERKYWEHEYGVRRDEYGQEVITYSWCQYGNNPWLEWSDGCIRNPRQCAARLVRWRTKRLDTWWHDMRGVFGFRHFRSVDKLHQVRQRNFIERQEILADMSEFGEAYECDMLEEYIDHPDFEHTDFRLTPVETKFHCPHCGRNVN